MKTKKELIVSIFAILCIAVLSMSIKHKANPPVEASTIPTPVAIVDSPTFKVCDVEKATELLRTQDYKTVLTKKITTIPNENDRIAAIETDSSLTYAEKWTLRSNKNFKPEGIPNRQLEDFADTSADIISSDMHPFVGALHTAYAQHYPLTISPDMIWLMIAQGFARHVNENGENMRHYFVDFEGKKNLDVRRDTFIKGSTENDWENVFPEFNEQIGEHVGKGLTDLITGDFSTTSLIEKTAFQITLMDAMKSYFSYSMTTACGIPEITLEGTTEDWKNIEQKAQQLARYDLDWWIPELLPILSEFTKASAGDVNVDFWESIYKWNEVGSGNPYVTGWILDFFPYLKYDNEYEVNPSVGSYARQMKKIESENSAIRVTTKNFSSGLSQADFVWNYLEQMFKMEFVAGFVGFQQDKETLSLRPEISWAIVDKNIPPTEKEIEAYRKGGDEKYLNSVDKKE